MYRYKSYQVPGTSYYVPGMNIPVPRQAELQQ